MNRIAAVSYLKNKFKNSTKIGRMRRKKRGKVSIKNSRINPQEKVHNNKIKNINNLIKNIEKIEVFNEYLDEMLFDFISNLKKKDFINRKEVDLEEFVTNYENFICSYIINAENSKAFTFQFNYQFYKKTFSEQGLDKFVDLIDEINSDINKKLYIHDEQQDEEKIENLRELHELLSLDYTESPTKFELRKAYINKSRRFHPDKNLDEKKKYSEIYKKINSAYRQLQKYYFKTSSKYLYT
jgi:hypothetical protein